jgi:hypothetical protein
MEYVVFVYWEDGHSGPGWYYYDREYPDEGSCGAFSSRSEAEEHAKDAYARD